MSAKIDTELAVVTCKQIRDARRLLGWSGHELARRAHLPFSTVARIETSIIGAPSLAMLAQTLEAAGVEFIAKNGGGPGVRLRRP
jgi:transcriptional regulator with XRE-family HTH domain